MKVSEFRKCFLEEGGSRRSFSVCLSGLQRVRFEAFLEANGFSISDGLRFCVINELERWERHVRGSGKDGARDRVFRDLLAEAEVIFSGEGE